MPIPNWDETTANGRRRVFRIEIDRPLGGDTVARFHIERVFVDANDMPISRTHTETWDLPMMQGVQDPELATFVINAANSLESIAEILYNRNTPKS